jgi:hypothetical protein
VFLTTINIVHEVGVQENLRRDDAIVQRQIVATPAIRFQTAARRTITIGTKP